MHPRSSMRSSLVPAFWASTLLSGCLALRTPEPGAPIRVEAGEGLVFGRVRAFELGCEITPWKRESIEVLTEDPDIRLALFHVESGHKRPNVPIAADGSFEWILPTGTYLLYHTPSIEPALNEPLAAFQSEPGSNPVDLGEIALAISIARSLSSTLATYTVLSVEARAGNSESAAAFLQRHPGSGSVREGAVVIDPELGGLFTNWSRAACARILGRHGMKLRGPEGR
jgi:hypothetical protein